MERQSRLLWRDRIAARGVFLTLSAGTRLGPYEILSPLGAGGMGEVYKAKDTRLDRTVAIKVLPSHLSENPEFKQRFEREAKAISQLSHPHICALYDVGNQDGVEYLVMELLEGQTLAERLGKGALPTDHVLKAGIEIADALDKAHKQGIVHRDLKPGNIMLTKSGVKLLDFGLAKVLLPSPGGPSPRRSGFGHAGGRGVADEGLSSLPTDLAPSQPLTERGTVLGTFQYMSPEQLEGKESDPRTDIFSFGCVLYEMATGKKAFTGANQASLISAIMSKEPEPISSIQPMTPPALDRVVTTCLAKDPDDRWQNAHDLMSELKWIAGAGSQAGAPAVFGSRRRNRERVAWTLAAVGLVVAAISILTALRRGTGEFPATRFNVLPDGEGSIEDFPAFSPDGRQLAYVKQGSDGMSSLWLHSFESGEARQIPETENAEEPFWSPDGSFLAFFSHGELKKISATGGSPQTLCAGVTDVRGGTWGLHGDILLSKTSAGGIFRLAPGSSEPVPLTQTDTKRGEQSHRYPWFLPDGRHYLYTVTGDPRQAGIYWSSVDSKERRRLTSSFSRAAFDPRGYLLFVRETSLMAQRFDADRGRLLDEPITLAEHVGSDAMKTGKSWFTVSPSGSFAFRIGAARQLAELLWVDRTGRRLSAVTSPSQLQEPALSPDGTRVAAGVWQAGYQDIWIFDASSTDRGSRLTFGPPQSETAIWSPDGTWIVYSGPRINGSTLMRKPSSGAGGEEIVFEGGTQTWPDDWSPDGRFIVFERYSKNSELWFLPMTGERKPFPYLQGNSNHSHSAFSPDGNYLAYVSDESGTPQIYVQGVPLSGSKWQISTRGGDGPVWRADGKELYFVGLDRMLTAVEIKSLRPFVAGTPQPLFRVSVPALGATSERTWFAPDRGGQRFLLNSMVATPTQERGIRVVLNWAPKKDTR